MIILRLLLLLTNLHLKLLSTQGAGADKLLSTQRVKVNFWSSCNRNTGVAKVWGLALETNPNMSRIIKSQIV